MRVKLLDIPDLLLEESSLWKVKVLSINNKEPALVELLRWKRTERNNYNKIIKAIKLASTVPRVSDKKKVKKSANASHGEVYEFRADKSHARLLFFYDKDETLIICTNHFWKGKGSQDAAFSRCNQMMKVYYGERKKQ